MSRFQALSAGKIIIPSISEGDPVQLLLGVVDIGFVESFPMGCEVTGSTTFFEQDEKTRRTIIVNGASSCFIGLDFGLCLRSNCVPTKLNA
jgi:hypothetical protein